VKRGREYEPLIDVYGVPSWPSKPLYDQLSNGKKLEQEGRAFEGHWEDRRAARKTLRVTEDFDFVVLGIGVAALPYAAGELVARSERWREMTERVKTVPTQAFQLWLQRDMHQLGWPHPPVNLSGFIQPFDTWADMTHLLSEESWPRSVRSVAYFCSVLSDEALGGAPPTRSAWERERRVVRDNAIRFLDGDVGHLWPGAVRGKGGFRWELLARPGEAGGTQTTRRAGRSRFDSQFWTANVNPSDRYVLSLPGTIRYRLSPMDMDFDNVTVAGDWTATGLDSGCIESAVMSGLLAAHALSGRPTLEAIVGYDHP
jgi:hypothetical protein